MKLLPNRKLIKDRRIARKTIFGKINRRKAIWKKWKVLFYVGRNTIIKRNYILVKKKRFFVQKNVARKFYTLKKQLRLFCLYSPYNLFFVVKSPVEYLKTKTDLLFSNLGLLNFKFWHLKKKWIFEIFKNQKLSSTSLPLLNGAVLVLKLDTISNLLETLFLFEHKSTVCVSVLFLGRMVWPSYFLDKVLNVDKNMLLLYTGLREETKKIIVYFRVLFCLFRNFFKKNANVISINF